MYTFIKRLIDILFAMAVLIIAFPVFITIMVLLAFTGDGQIFYLQQRIGYKNRPFYIFKFATMRKNSDNTGTGDVTVRNDPRLLPLGKVLRKTKLNELPQVLNILKGEMTLIGPRPLMTKGFLRYSEEVRAVIYNVKPGLTGIGSVIFRDEEMLVASSTDHEELYRNINRQKGQLEIWYQKNQSLITDTLIVCLTAVSIMLPTQTLTYKVFKTLPDLDDISNYRLNIRHINKQSGAEKMNFQKSFS